MCPTLQSESIVSPHGEHRPCKCCSHAVTVTMQCDYAQQPHPLTTLEHHQLCPPCHPDRLPLRTATQHCIFPTWLYTVLHLRMQLRATTYVPLVWILHFIWYCHIHTIHMHSTCTTQYNTVQYSTVQYSTVQYSTGLWGYNASSPSAE